MEDVNPITAQNLIKGVSSQLEKSTVMGSTVIDTYLQGLYGPDTTLAKLRLSGLNPGDIDLAIASHTPNLNVESIANVANNVMLRNLYPIQYANILKSAGVLYRGTGLSEITGTNIKAGTYFTQNPTAAKLYSVMLHGLNDPVVLKAIFDMPLPTGDWIIGLRPAPAWFGFGNNPLVEFITANPIVAETTNIVNGVQVENNGFINWLNDQYYQIKGTKISFGDQKLLEAHSSLVATKYSGSGVIRPNFGTVMVNFNVGNGEIAPVRMSTLREIAANKISASILAMISPDTLPSVIANLPSFLTGKIPQSHFDYLEVAATEGPYISTMSSELRIKDYADELIALRMLNENSTYSRLGLKLPGSRAIKTSDIANLANIYETMGVFGYPEESETYVNQLLRGDLKTLIAQHPGAVTAAEEMISYGQLKPESTDEESVKPGQLEPGSIGEESVKPSGSRMFRTRDTWLGSSAMGWATSVYSSLGASLGSYVTAISSYGPYSPVARYQSGYPSPYSHSSYPSSYNLSAAYNPSPYYPTRYYPSPYHPTSYNPLRYYPSPYYSSPYYSSPYYPPSNLSSTPSSPSLYYYPYSGGSYYSSNIYAPKSPPPTTNSGIVTPWYNWWAHNPGLFYREFIHGINLDPSGMFGGAKSTQAAYNAMKVQPPIILGMPKSYAYQGPTPTMSQVAVKTSPMPKTNARVYVNGRFMGYTEHPSNTAEGLNEMKQKGQIPIN